MNKISTNAELIKKSLKYQLVDGSDDDGNNYSIRSYKGSSSRHKSKDKDKVKDKDKDKDKDKKKKRDRDSSSSSSSIKNEDKDDRSRYNDREKKYRIKGNNFLAHFIFYSYVGFVYFFWSWR